jgi:hypothetical protein
MPATYPQLPHVFHAFPFLARRSLSRYYTQSRIFQLQYTAIFSHNERPLAGVSQMKRSVQSVARQCMARRADVWFKGVRALAKSRVRRLDDRPVVHQIVSVPSAHIL